MYFYAQTKPGELPPAEPVITGQHVYRVRLDNIYDANEDPLGLWPDRDDRPDWAIANEFERAVIAAGFDGYLTPHFKPSPGVVLLNTDSVPVEYMGNRQQAARQLVTEPASATGGSARVVNVQSVMRMVERVSKGWKASPKINVVASVTELPARLREWVYSQGAQGETEGLYDPHTGEVYLITANIRNMDRASFVLAHEVLGHGGLRKLLGERLYPILREIYASNASVRERADRLRADRGISLEIATEEVLADMAGEGKAKDLTGWQKLVKAIKSFFADLGFTHEWTDDDVQTLVAAARWAIEDAMTSPFSVTESAVGSPRIAASESAPVWYSQLARTIAATKTESMPSQQWKAYINNLVSKGVKTDEIEWSGVREWLDTQQGKVQKQAILDFLNANGVKVEETMLGMPEPSPELEREIAWMGNDVGDDYNWQEIANQLQDAAQLAQEKGHTKTADRLWRHYGEATLLAEAQEGSHGGPKYAGYALPGGKNYRELLLTLPTRGGSMMSQYAMAEIDRQLKARGMEPMDAGQRATLGRLGNEALDMIEDFELLGIDVREARSELSGAEGTDGIFRSPHFDQPNILAHVRFDERANAEGKRVLFIQEIQSDWAQKGKREGFSSSELPEGYTARLTEAPQDPDFPWRVVSPWQVVDPEGQVVSTGRSREEAVARFMRGAVPSAPFVGKTTAWTALALKRMIRYAAENGFDAIAWTTGEQQNKRYDLSKHIKELRVERISGLRGHEYALTARQHGGGRVANLRAWTADDLPDVIGKAMAEKIIANKSRAQIYRDLDIKVGGEGMVAFYDHIVPNVANDVLKKLGGGRMGDVAIKLQAAEDELEVRERPRNPASRRWGVVRVDERAGTTAVLGEFSSHGQAVAYIDLLKQQQQQQPGFYLTPELKAKATEGMPLFSQQRTSGLADMLGAMRGSMRKRPRRGSNEDFSASRGYERVAKLFRALARDDETFQYGDSNDRRMWKIAEDMNLPNVERVTQMGDSGRLWRVEMKQQKWVPDLMEDVDGNPIGGTRPVEAIIETGGEKLDIGDVEPTQVAWVNVADFTPGSRGSEVYQLAFTWAARNGYVLIGDPHGVSPKAVERRVDNMLSAALRLGTTAFMRPASPGDAMKKMPAWAKELSREWKTVENPGDGADQHNLRMLLKSQLAVVEGKIDDLAGVRYNFESERFQDEDGKFLSDEDLDRIAAKAVPVGVQVPGDGRDGQRPGVPVPDGEGSEPADVAQGGASPVRGARSTFKRAVIIRSALDLSPSDVARLSGWIGSGDRPAAGTPRKGILYSLAPAHGLSPSGPVDSLMQRLGGRWFAEHVSGPLHERLLDLGARVVPERVKAGMTSNSGLPEPYIDRRDEMRIAQRKAAKRVVRYIERLVGLNRAQSRVAYQWMTQREVEGDRLLAQLPEEQAAVLRELKSYITELGAEAVRLGLLSPESYARNKNAFLHRSYEKHELDQTDGERASRERAIRVMGEQFKGRGLVDWVETESLVEKPTIERGIAHATFPGAEVETGITKATFPAGPERGAKFIRLEKRSRVTDREVEGGADPAELRLRAVKYVPAGEPISDKYLGWHQDGVWELRYEKGGKTGMWRDFTEAERTRMGELDEVRFAVAKTLLGMTRDIESARFLDWVSREYGKDELVGPGQRLVPAPTGRSLQSFGKDEWVQVPQSTIPGSPVSAYGALAGKFIPASMWNDIRQATTERFSPFGETYSDILRAWKVSKTALSPAVHMNNIMANVLLADMADVGILDVLRSVRVFAEAKLRNDPEAKALLDRFDESGAELGSYALTELQKKALDPLLEELRAEVNKAEGMSGLVRAAHVIESLASGKFAEAREAFGASKSWAVSKKMANAMIEMYHLEDQVFRFAAWQKAVNEGKSDLQAGKIAREAFLDYNINAPWVQNMRATFLPFIAFTYRALPKALEAAAHKPWKLAKYFAAFGALNAIAYASLGLGGDDEDRERKMLPEEQSGKMWGIAPRLIRMPWNDKHGSPVFLDVRRWIPVGDIIDTTQHHAALDFPQAMMPGGPLMLLAEVLLNKQGFTGQKIVLESDSKYEKAKKMSQYLYQSFAPNFPGLPGTYATRKIGEAATGKTDPFGREYSVPQAVLSTVGVKLASYPEDVMHRNLQSKLTASMLEQDIEFAKVRRAYARKGISEEEFREELNAYQQRKRELREKFRDKVR